MKDPKEDDRFEEIDPWKSIDLSYRRRHLPHLETPGATYFVSFSTSRRYQLQTEARDLVMAEIRSADGDSIDLDAAVVMPDHVHLILRVVGTSGLTSILKRIKGRTAHKINQRCGRKGPVWTPESFDHVIRHGAEWEEKIEYVRQNPMTSGLVASPDQYRWLFIKRSFSE